MINQALNYLKLGFPIFPVGKDKRPIVEWKKYQTELPTEDEVKKWFSDTNSLIGLATGKFSNIVVIDDDRKKHGLKDYEIESNLISQTQSGGKHYFFKYSEGIRNTTNDKFYLDIRGDGGYVVIPPSKDYCWLKNSLTRETLNKLQTIPNDLILLIYGNTGISREKFSLKKVLNISHGARNDTLFRFACSLRARGFSNEEVVNFLTVTNNNCSDPLSQSELETILNSSLRYNYADNNEDNLHSGIQLSSIIKNQSEVIKMRLSERELEKEAYTTGYKSLDQLIKGFIPHHVYILSGFTNFGKSSLACNFTERLRSIGKRVLYLAFETGNKIVEVMASIRNKKKYRDLFAEDLEAKKDTIDFVTETLTVEQLKDLLIKKSSFYDLVIIDHLSYFISGKDSISQESDLMKTIAKLAKDSHMPILGIVHTRKSGNKKEDKKPSLEDIKGSSAFYQDATEVLMLYRNLNDLGEYEEEGFLFVRKQKSGRNGVVKLYWHDFSAVITEKDDTFYEQEKVPEYFQDI